MAALFQNAVERPARHSEARTEAGMKLLLADVMQWWRAQYPPSFKGQIEEEDDILADLVDCYENHPEDGYQFARDLERSHGWSPDTWLVDILDNADACHHKAYREVVKKWVKDYDIKPPLAIGTRVKANWGLEVIEGTITRIYEDEACYVVNRSDDGPGAGAHVDYERVIEVLES